MAKKGRKRRKLKKGAILPISLFIFFVLYFVSFWWFSKDESKLEEVTVENQSQKESNRSLLSQLRYKNKIYLSDGKVSNIRVEKEYWDELDYILAELNEVRTPNSYEEIYSGNSDYGLKFSTDLNYLRI